jgi:hypothetical protein
MTCYSSYLVGAFAFALIMYDMMDQNWSALMPHALGGVVLTGMFWGLCFILGDSISLAILVIPILFFIVFSMGILMTGESLKRQGCCVKCGPNRNSCEPVKEREREREEECIPLDAKLKAISLI